MGGAQKTKMDGLPAWSAHRRFSSVRGLIGRLVVTRAVCMFDGQLDGME